MMRLRAPNLLTRGIVLVAFPLICQLVFMFELSCSFKDIYTKLNRESHSQKIVQTAYNTFCELSDDWLEMGLDMRSNGDLHIPQIKKILKRRALQLDEIVRLVQGEPYQKATITTLSVYAHKMLNLVGSAVPETGSEQSRLHERTFGAQLREFGVPTMKALRDIIINEDVQNKVNVEATSTAIDRLMQAIAIALPVSILLTLALGLYFVVSVRRPLLHLIENGRLLSSRQPLLPPLESAAEFSSLDALLHTVSYAVEEALSKDADAVANAMDLIWTLDEHGICQDVNPSIETLLGYKQDEVVGRNINDLVDGEQVLTLINNLQQAIQSSEVHTFELEMCTRNATTVYTRWSSSWSTKHSLLFCVVHDISEKKRIESLKKEFAEMISQDLQIPLVEMHASLKSILSGSRGEVGAPAEKSLKQAEISLERLIMLANELLDFHKLEGGQMQIEPADCDLKDVANEAVDWVRSLAEAKQITLVLPVTSQTIKCDRLKIVQLLVNLIGNAIKFTPEKGVVEIRVEQYREFIEIMVIDSGPGIPQDYQEIIFEPFEQVPGAQASIGTGLGLAICKMIAVAHGGSIAVASGEAVRVRLGTINEKEIGSVFSIRIPKEIPNKQLLK